MARIIRLPVQLQSYPESPDDLDRAEHLLLVAIRGWVADYKQECDPIPRLCDAMNAAGAPDAAFSIDHWMMIVARTAKRPIEIHCPQCPHLSDDEKHMIHAASLAQAGDVHCATCALSSPLLSTFGAEFAVGPLRGLGVLFGAAGLRFRLRRPPLDAINGSGADDRWGRTDFDQTVH